MLLLLLLLVPATGIFIVYANFTFSPFFSTIKGLRFTGITTGVLNLFISLAVFIFFDFSSNQLQFVQEYHKISFFDFYLGVDGLSIYFILLTTIVTPISLLSNWRSIVENIKSFVIVILLLETLLLAVFLVLDLLLFYVFFESLASVLLLLFLGILARSLILRWGLKHIFFRFFF